MDPVDGRFHVTTDDGFVLSVFTDRGAYPNDLRERRNTIYVGPNGCCPTCGKGKYPAEPLVDPENRTVVFVTPSTSNKPTMLEQVVAFRYPKARSPEMPEYTRLLHERAFPIDQPMNAVIGGITYDRMVVLWLLTLASELFTVGRFPYPLPSEREILKILRNLETEWKKIYAERARNQAGFVRELAQFGESISHMFRTIERSESAG